MEASSTPTHEELNAVACTYDGMVGRARRLLSGFGHVRKTGFRNVILLAADDPAGLLDRLTEVALTKPDVLETISRLVPARVTFSFQSPEEFEGKAREIALGWVGELAGTAFHVRLHRRGFKGRLASTTEEQFLDRVLLDALEAAGTPGSITFDDPDAILSIETVGNWAGMSLWTREQLVRHPLLKLD